MLYGAPRHANLVTELLIEETLVLVETTGGDREIGLADLVEIDWGRDFAANFRAAFPGTTAAVKVNYGPIALDYLLAHGGTAYLRMMVARPLLESGRVRLVADAPKFPYSIHAVYSTNAESSVIQLIRHSLRSAMGWDRPSSDSAHTSA